MMRRIVGASLLRPTLVLVLAAAVLVFGFVGSGSTQVDSLPHFSPVVVEVQTEALGLSAAEVEQLITVPLEADLLNGVAWLDTIRSESIPGLSTIRLTFEEGTDLLEARQVVQERLTQAAGLPNVSRAPSMIQPLSSESRVMMIGLSSDEVSLIDMSVLSRWTVRPFLMGVPGVANVSVWGQRERQLQVQVEPDDLEAADLTLLDVVKTTGNALWVSPLSYLEASTPGTGGFIDGPNQRIGVQHVFAIDGPEDLAAVTVEGADGITLGDVTTVLEDHQPLIGDALVDEGPGLLLVVEKFPWANTVEVTEAVEDALVELAPGMTGIDVDTELFRPASYVERSIDNVQTTAVVALVLAIVVLFALFYSWRAALISLVALLTSLAGVAVILNITDTTVDLMVMAGVLVALGLVIDDSIGSVAALRRPDDDADETAPLPFIQRAVVSSRSPMVYATVAMAFAIVPVFAMEGAAGEFLPSVALAMVLTLVVSLVITLTVVPAMGLLLAGADGSKLHRTSPLLAPVGRLYGKVMHRWTSRATGALIASIVLVALAAALLPTLDKEFVPDFRQTDLVVAFDGVAGTSLEETSRVTALAGAELRTVPGVEDVGIHVGRAILSDETVNVNAGELWVRMDPDADYRRTLDSIRAVVQGYPGFGVPDALSYSNERVDALLRQRSDDLVVRVYGEDPVVLGDLADEVAAMVAGVEGTANVRAVHPILQPTVEIEVDLERAEQYQVKPGDVRRAAATLLSGIEVGSFFEEQKVFEVVVWSPPERRNSVTAIEQLNIDTPSGDVVALSEVADVRVAPNEQVIERDAVSRYIDVVADLSGRDRDAVAGDITDQIEAQGLPFEYHVRILDDRSDAAANQRQVIGIAIGAAIAVFLLLQAAFRSWRLAGVLLLVLPLGLVGGIVSLTLTGGTYSIGSAVGFLAVGGLTVRAVLALSGRYETLQLDQGVAFDQDLVTKGAREQFTPTLITLVTVAVVMATIVVSGEVAGQEVARPAAIVVLGGLVTVAMAALFVFPALYGRFGAAAQPRESLLTTRSGDV
ncbi:MAG: efflux RND transporter permease subunit [Acidimicrobiia bacterium]|nr:efflux RND transporter permease subunit [Acidimicrobiia bacterium]